MKVVVCEKPSVAGDIAKVLKAGTRKDGYYEGNGTLVTWAFGHLVQLVNPEDYHPKYKSWIMEHLPIIPTVFKKEPVRSASSRKQLSLIKALLTRPDIETVICATDAGREGELIFRLIYEYSGCTKPIQRLWVSSQTDQAISDGFRALKSDADVKPLYDSALCRSQADWLIGMNASRAYTVKCAHGTTGVLSVGRVQTPVLNMIVTRYRENQAFVPQTFYELHADISHANGAFKAKWFQQKEDRFSDKKQAEAILASVQTHPNGVISQLSQKDKHEKPPLLYDLTELQRDANKKFKFSADKTLKLMQALYEQHKVLTYPRTSSRYLSTDMEPKLAGLVENLRDIPDYTDIVLAVNEQGVSPTKRVIDDTKVTDHHAIIPTDKKADLARLSKDEQSIFDLVVRRFLSVFLPDCVKGHTEIVTLFGEHTFKTSGTMIKKPGWRLAYGAHDFDLDDPLPKKGKSAKSASKAEPLLPTVVQGDAIRHTHVQLTEGQTKPPPLYNEASILAAMETAGKQIDDDELRQAMKDCGLGTPATRAQILERLIQVGYIIREKNRLIPTDKGQYLIDCIVHSEFLSPELTGQWEKKLNDMAMGRYKAEDYMNEITDFTRDVVNAIQTQEGGEASSKKSLGTCPKCEGAITESRVAYGCSNWSTRQCDFKIWKVLAGRPITSKEAKILLQDGKTEVLSGFKSKEGNEFSASLALVDFEVKFGFDKPSLGACPLCGGEIKETTKAYSCSNWREKGCSFAIWKEMAGKKIPIETAKVLLASGQHPVIKGFKSRAGKSFDAALALKDGKVSFVFENTR